MSVERRDCAPLRLPRTTHKNCSAHPNHCLEKQQTTVTKAMHLICLLIGSCILTYMSFYDASLYMLWGRCFRLLHTHLLQSWEGQA